MSSRTLPPSFSVPSLALIAALSGVLTFPSTSWAGPAPAPAAEPDKAGAPESPSPAPEQQDQRQESKPKSKRKQKKDQELRRAEKRKAQKQLLDSVEPFEVRVMPVETDAFAETLHSRCSSPAMQRWAAPAKDRKALAPLLGPTMLDDFDQAKALLKDDSTQDEAIARAREFAEQVRDAGRSFHGLCVAVRDGSLAGEHDIDDLRALRSQTHALAWEQLVYLTTNHMAELEALLLDAPEGLTEDRRPAAIEQLRALTLGQPGVGLSDLTTATPPLAGIGQVAFEGLGEFLIDRAKEEVIRYLQDKLVVELCGEKSVVGSFIPETCAVLSELDPAMSIMSMGAALHETVIEDLEMLPDRGLALAAHEKPELMPAMSLFRVFIPMVRSAEARARPMDYATSIHAGTALECEKVEATEPGSCVTTMQAVRSASATLDALAGTMTTADGKRRFMSAGKLDPAAVPFIAVSVALGVEQRLAAVADSENNSLPTPTVTGKTVGAFAETIPHLVQLLANAESALRGLKAKIEAGQALDPAVLVQLSTLLMLDLTEVLDAQLERRADLYPWLPATEQARLAKFETKLEEASEIIEIAAAFANEDWAAAALGTVRFIRGAGGDDSALNALGEYLPLFIELASADSSADVNAALEAAFPPGGYAQKFRQRGFSLTGMLGMYGGATFSQELEAGAELSGYGPGFELAMFAPVGLQYTRPVGHARRKSHVGAYFTVVDVGAITTSKWLTQESTEPETVSDEMGATIGSEEAELGEPTAVNLGGLVAPGFYFTVGLGESPFVLGAGASVVPFAQRRTITRRDTDGEIETTQGKFLPAMRAGVFLAVDITFLNFGRRPK